MTATFTAAPSVAGLTPYAGAFGREEAGHLLRRCVMGATLAEIDRAVRRGLSATLDSLLAPAAPPPPPVNHYFEDDPNVAVGATWIKAPYRDDVNVTDYRRSSMRGWYHQILRDAPMNIREKMTLFWINHFGIGDIDEQRANYQYLRLYQQYALGNFRELIKKMTVNPAMLNFLNGQRNRKQAPDENYARELLELFTVQKGRPGDVNYTEEDIREIARVLTGWRISGMYSSEYDEVSSYFYENWHDTGTKQLSAYFDNAVIENGGSEEYKTLIDIIFRHPEAPKAIVRDLYTFFVDHEIDDSVERNVIDPLAALLLDNNFELRPVVRELLGSQQFFNAKVRGTMVKSPYEFSIGMTRALGGYDHLGLDLYLRYELGQTYHYRMRNDLDMDFLFLPSVSGWKAYYQAPAYDRTWISSASLLQRRRWVKDFCRWGIWSKGTGRPVDWLAFIDSMPASADVNRLLEDITATFFAVPPTPRPTSDNEERAAARPAGPGMDHTVPAVPANGPDSDIGKAVQKKVRELFEALFSIAEFHLQ